jgi:hypothetical protein
MTGIYCARNDGALIRHREAKGRGDPSSMKRTHGLPRFARNDGRIYGVIFRGGLCSCLPLACGQQGVRNQVIAQEIAGLCELVQ